MDLKEFIAWLLENESREGFKALFYFSIDRKLFEEKIKELGYKLQPPGSIKDLIS